MNSCSKPLWDFNSLMKKYFCPLKNHCKTLPFIPVFYSKKSLRTVRRQFPQWSVKMFEVRKFGNEVVQALNLIDVPMYLSPTLLGHDLSNSLNQCSDVPNPNFIGTWSVQQIDLGPFGSGPKGRPICLRSLWPRPLWLSTFWRSKDELELNWYSTFLDYFTQPRYDCIQF